MKEVKKIQLLVLCVHMGVQLATTMDGKSIGSK